jgi:arsenate reductase
MAEAILRQHYGDGFDAYSAGTDPKGINPLTVRVLNEIGIDISQQHSKDVKQYLGRLPVTYLVIVCAEAEKKCPTIWPGALQRMHWPFDDPAAAEGTEEQRIEAFREIRDQIKAKIDEWVAECGDG